MCGCDGFAMRMIDELIKTTRESLGACRKAEPPNALALLGSLYAGEKFLARSQSNGIPRLCQIGARSLTHWKALSIASYRRCTVVMELGKALKRGSNFGIQLKSICWCQYGELVVIWWAHRSAYGLVFGRLSSNEHYFAFFWQTKLKFLSHF